MKLRFRDISGRLVTCHRMLQALQKVWHTHTHTHTLCRVGVVLCENIMVTLMSAQEDRDKDTGHVLGEDWK